MTDVLDRIEFIASLSSTQRHPIKLGNDTGQMTIELPKSEANALLLVAMYYADKTFKVTIEPDDSERERDEREREKQWSYDQAKSVA